MESCFRIAVWSIVFLRFLQARPVCVPPIDVSEISLYDLRLSDLKDSIVCENRTFVSPACASEHCQEKALAVMKDGLDQAQKECTGDLYIIDQTMEALFQIPRFSEMITSSNYNTTSNEAQKNFKGFVNDCEALFQFLNSRKNLEPNNCQE